MEIIADLHTHTIASTHAYSTITEMVQAASAKNLYAIAITDHGDVQAFPDAAKEAAKQAQKYHKNQEKQKKSKTKKPKKEKPKKAPPILGGDANRKALLRALRPYMNRERQTVIDRAIQFSSMAEIMAAMMGSSDISKQKGDI